MEALLRPAPLQPLQVQQVLELQVASVCLAAPDLPQGFAEAAADAFAGEEAVLLDLAPQRLGDAGLVAAGDGEVRQRWVLGCPQGRRAVPTGARLCVPPPQLT